MILTFRENKKLIGSLKMRIKISGFVLLSLFFFVWTSMPIVSSADNYTADDLCEILVKSNMRSTPSKDGGVVTKVPEGAIAIVLNDDNSDFMEIKYGDSVGYIFRGCVSVKKPHTVDEYNEQFGQTSSLGKRDNNTAKAPASPTSPVAENPVVSTADTERAKALETGTYIIRKDTANTIEEKADNKEKIEDNKASIHADNKTEPEKKQVSAGVFIGNTTGGSMVSGSSPSVPSSTSAMCQGSVITALKLRSGPGTSYSQISSIPSGATITVIDEGQDGFYHVKYNGQEGYAYSNCVKVSGQVASKEESTSSSVQTASSGEGGLLLAGTRRSSVKAEPAENINSVNNSNLSSKPEAETTSSLTKNFSYEISKRANMRSLPSKESGKLTTIPTGAEVVALGKSKDGYTLVQYNGMEGYVLEELVTEGVSVELTADNAVLFTITAYCPCAKCCGSYSPEVRGGEPHTATGTVPCQGRTIAVDPSVIPYGTRVTIEGLGTFTAEDCGSSVDGEHIDIYFENHEDAVAFGVKRLYVSIAE